MKLWKISNKSNPSQSVKVSVRKSIMETVGVVLQPGQFVICTDQITNTIDAQERRRLISVDRDFVNKYNLELGVCHNEADLTNAIRNAEAYASTVQESKECAEEDPADHFDI